MIHVIRRREGRFLLIAVHGRAGRVEKVLHRVMAACFENIEKSHDVRLDVRTGIVDAVAHARLRGKVHHDVRPEILKKLRHRRFIGQVAAGESKRRFFLKDGEARFLKGHVVVVVQIVNAADGSPQREESLRQMESDESRRAGDEHFFLTGQRAENLSWFLLSPARRGRGYTPFLSHRQDHQRDGSPR